MKVIVKPGGQEVTLTKRDFLAAGGQGEVYAQGKVAYKVYHDPKAMIPQGKVSELATIQNPQVIRPDKMLCDAKGHVVGYTMRFIKDAWTLCQLFPMAFRLRNNITPDQMGKLVLSLRKMVADVHQAGVLIVDLNEMNSLVAQDFSEVYGIDADSYQTKSYPATVIMPSVMDPHVKGHDFTEGSDWFSFGIVAFQMFVGIHPYKGKHPSFLGENSLTQRMQAGISVFNKDVRVPKAVLPFDTIPAAYKSWFEAVFEQGKRQAPPTDFTGAVLVVTPLVRTISGTSNLDIHDLLSFSEPVVGVWHSFGGTLVSTQGGIYIGGMKVQEPQALIGVTFTQRQNKAVTAWLDGETLRLFDTADRREMTLPLAVEQAMCCDGRIYVKVGGQVHEVILAEAGTRIIPSSRAASNCMEKATRLYDGVVIQSLLGKTHVSLFPGPELSETLPLHELDAYKVVDARCVKNVLMVIGHKGSKYDRLVIRFSTDRKEYDVRVVTDITPAGLNFTVLDTGVVACLNEDEKLELFGAKRGHQGVKIVEDAMLGNDMRLGAQDGKVIFWRGTKVCQIKTR